MARGGIRMPDEAEPDFPSRFLACGDTSSRRMAPGVVPRHPKAGSFAGRPTHAVCRQPVRSETRSCYKVGMAPHRILIHISRSEHRVLDPDDVYFLRARGGETEVRLRSRTLLVDLRSIGEVLPLLEPFGFVRIHREHVVNIARIRILRLQADGRDWELKLEPPVNKVLSIARDRLAGLRAALGEPSD